MKLRRGKVTAGGADEMQTLLVQVGQVFESDALRNAATLGAFFVALWVADSGRRAQKQRDITIVKAVLIPLVKSREELFKALDRDVDGILSDHANDRIGELYLRNPFRDAAAFLDRLDPSKLPTTIALDGLISGRAALERVQEEIRLVVTGVEGAKELVHVLSKLDMACGSVGAEVARLGGKHETHDTHEIGMWIWPR